MLWKQAEECNQTVKVKLQLSLSLWTVKLKRQHSLSFTGISTSSIYSETVQLQKHESGMIEGMKQMLLPTRRQWTNVHCPPKVATPTKWTCLVAEVKDRRLGRLVREMLRLCSPPGTLNLPFDPVWVRSGWKILVFPSLQSREVKDPRQVFWAVFPFQFQISYLEVRRARSTLPFGPELTTTSQGSTEHRLYGERSVQFTHTNRQGADRGALSKRSNRSPEGPKTSRLRDGIVQTQLYEFYRIDTWPPGQASCGGESTFWNLTLPKLSPKFSDIHYKTHLEVGIFLLNFNKQLYFFIVPRLDIWNFTLLFFFITTLLALVLSTLRLRDREEGLFVPSTNMFGPSMPENNMLREVCEQKRSTDTLCL